MLLGRVTPGHAEGHAHQAGVPAPLGTKFGSGRGGIEGQGPRSAKAQRCERPVSGRLLKSGMSARTRSGRAPTWNTSEGLQHLGRRNARKVIPWCVGRGGRPSSAPTGPAHSAPVFAHKCGPLQTHPLRVTSRQRPLPGQSCLLATLLWGSWRDRSLTFPGSRPVCPHEPLRLEKNANCDLKKKKKKTQIRRIRLQDVFFKRCYFQLLCWGALPHMHNRKHSIVISYCLVGALSRRVQSLVPRGPSPGVLGPSSGQATDPLIASLESSEY